MEDISKQVFVNESYPQLTVANVRYWYWEVDPHWSAIDIAKVIGCNFYFLY